MENKMYSKFVFFSLVFIIIFFFDVLFVRDAMTKHQKIFQQTFVIFLFYV